MVNDEAEIILLDLALPHVSPSNRAEISRILKPVLARVTVPCVSGRCYELAAEIARLGGPRFKYVEGTWQRGPLDPDGPQSHAWVTIDSFVFDLFEEFFIEENGDEGWIHTAAIGS